MVSNISVNATLFNEIMTDTSVLNITWLVALLALMLSLVLLSREPKSWTILAFPLTVGWHIVGLTPNILQYLITGVMFAISILSVRDFSSLIDVVTGKSRKKYDNLYIKNEVKTATGKGRRVRNPKNLS